MAEPDVPAVATLGEEMIPLLAGENARELDHKQISSRLDQAGELFGILRLKSMLAIPYTSVFLELDGGYWNEEADKRLRDARAK